LNTSAAGDIRAKASAGVIVAGASGKSTITTVAVTSPVDINLSSIRGQPPIDTSPRPSATGNLQSAVTSVGIDSAVTSVGIDSGAQEVNEIDRESIDKNTISFLIIDRV
jgi:hypothetical protein